MSPSKVSSGLLFLIACLNIFKFKQLSWYFFFEGHQDSETETTLIIIKIIIKF